MKPRDLSAVLIFFRSDIRKPISIVLILAVFHLTFSCTYYQYKVEKDHSAVVLEQLRQSPNYLIVHQGEQAFHISDVKIDQTQQVLTGTLADLPPEHMSYKTTKPKANSPNRYVKKPTAKRIGTPEVINEVHFYTQGLTLASNESVTIPISAIQRIEVYDPDVGATVLAVMGSVLLIMTVITVIVIATKSSCPFVYSHDGEEYIFAGEIYSGSIFRHLERDDYLLLPKTTSDSLTLVVANRLKEKQFINQLELIEIKHPAGTTIRADQKGNAHIIRHEVPLQSAFVGTQDVTALLRDRDSLNFLFDAEHQDDYFNEVVLTFPRHPATQEGHLVVRGKNSMWGDYVFGEFTRLFGREYNAWIDQQNQRNRPMMENWATEQGLTLDVLIQEKGKWKPVETTTMVGPLGVREWVIPIDLSRHTGGEVTVKLRSGFRMWDLDYVAMDYSDDRGLETRVVSPASAISQDGADVLRHLQNADTHYLEQLTTGDEVYIQFQVNHNSGEVAYDYLLHSRGYYNHVRDYSHDPDRMALLSFKTPGRFSRFSKEKLLEMQDVFQHAVVSASAQ